MSETLSYKVIYSCPPGAGADVELTPDSIIIKQGGQVVLTVNRAVTGIKDLGIRGIRPLSLRT